MWVVLAIFIDLYKELKTLFNYFVANLAMCDFFVGIVIDPLSESYLYYEGVLWKFPAQLIFPHAPYLASCTASVLSLAALTVDRYWAITLPLSYRLKLNPKHAGFIVLLIWSVFHFLLACMSFDQLPKVHLRVRSHRHPRNISHHVIYLFEDISSLDAANSTVVGGRQWIRWQPGQKGSNKMGTESVPSMFDLMCTVVFASHSLNDIMICGLKRCSGDNTRRKKQEMRLIFELGTLKPNGLNINFSFI